MNFGNTSVADGVPFSPNLPSATINNDGNIMRYNSVTQLWENTETLIHHNWAPIQDDYTTTLNGTLTLTASSNYMNDFFGTATGYKIKLPVATTLPTGWKYELNNLTNQTIAVQYQDGTSFFTLSQNSTAFVTLQDNTTSNGAWIAWQVLNSSTASGVISYNLISTTPFNTTSATDVIVTGFTVTPQAGTYGVWFSSDANLSANNSIGQYVIFKNGVAVADSRRQVQGSSSNFKTQLSTLAIFQATGSEAVDVRVNITSGTFTVNQRSLLLIRLGA